MKLVKVNIEDLQVGMYVAKLDRAWVDTPFMFQGFYIKNEEDISSLNKHCHYIYTDPDKTDSEKDKLENVPTITKSTATNEIGLPLEKIDYLDTTSAEDEMAFAKECHEYLSQMIGDIMSDVRDEKTIKIPENAKDTVSNMVQSMARNPDAFVWLTKMKDMDSYTYKHSLDASILGVTFGRHLGLDKDELQNLAIGILLCDVGKMKLPPKLLTKPGRLTEDEFALVKKHVEYSAEIMKTIDGISQQSIEIGLYHHERHNGNGYPDGTKGNDIPIFARIAALVDCFDAMTSDRPFQQAISSHQAVVELYKWRGIDFQEELIEQFIQCLGIYPTGSLVELSTGEVAIVLSQNRVRRLRPKLILILDPDKVAYDCFPMYDLSTETTDKDDNPLEIVATHEPGSFGIDPKALYL